MRVAEATVTTLHQDDPLTDLRQIGNNMLALIVEDLRASFYRRNTESPPFAPLRLPPEPGRPLSALKCC